MDQAKKQVTVGSLSRSWNRAYKRNTCKKRRAMDKKACEER